MPHGAEDEGSAIVGKAPVLDVPIFLVWRLCIRRKLSGRAIGPSNHQTVFTFWEHALVNVLLVNPYPTHVSVVGNQHTVAIAVMRPHLFVAVFKDHLNIAGFRDHTIVARRHHLDGRALWDRRRVGSSIGSKP